MTGNDKSISTETHILIIEDEEQIRSLVSDALIAPGITCTSCVNGLEATSVISKQNFNLIISDIMMPKMGGLDFLKSMRKLGNLTPILFLTAYGDKTKAIEALKLGATDFLEKPITLEKLRNSVYRSLEISKREREIGEKKNDRLLALLRLSNTESNEN